MLTSNASGCLTGLDSRPNRCTVVDWQERRAVSAYGSSPVQKAKICHTERRNSLRCSPRARLLKTHATSQVVSIVHSIVHMPATFGMSLYP